MEDAEHLRRQIVNLNRQIADKHSAIISLGNCAKMQDATIAALRKRVEELEGALGWVEPAMQALTSYENDYGKRLPEDRQIGKIDDSRNSASFRLYVGHIRRMHAALRAKGGDNGDA